jgi:signal transduction histidine kinase
LLADDQEIVRRGLASLLSQEPTVEVVGEAANGREAVALVDQLHPDAVLMDVSMPQMNDWTEVLRWLAQRMRQQHGLTTQVDIFGKISVPTEALTMFLFRAAQEMLFNVVEHAGVKEAVLLVRWIGPYVRLRVSDRGCGFDPQVRKKTCGIVLFSLRERVELLGGRMKIQSAVGRGSKFTMMVPDAPTREQKQPAESDFR